MSKNETKELLTNPGGPHKGLPSARELRRAQQRQQKAKPVKQQPRKGFR